MAHPLARCAENCDHGDAGLTSVNALVAFRAPTRTALFASTASSRTAEGCGVTIPIVDRRGGVAAVTFAADEPNRSFLLAAERYETGASTHGDLFPHSHSSQACYRSSDKMVLR
ncbi:hypothetical protein D3227_28430 [Mesorhizobium waimense]|uniref:Uncharacterized protein n=1 Tax=Mesorhizobium waimense TaxID=1300307 RepID=A0A3A5K8H9_9HYPH|nr:autoinducer binding domain-containing protein [Mesorhizobium waimense]RJT31465.1 hypothetical protein D3227_28430 [Mesorhizobium waimense]